MKPPMDANERELILKEEVYAVVGCAIEVLTRVGAIGPDEGTANEPESTPIRRSRFPSLAPTPMTVSVLFPHSRSFAFIRG